ncbi:metallopeptidase family protein [Rathayibacter soli]|uniref:metallopeptidase family protein n=1 Tax=Rathayibacter soli TaxID=3144168 RepID=UPI0027E4F8D5|nr:metallopeptidase family protein [Glaciibacter superstes]
MEMSADEFQQLVTEEFEALPNDMVDGVENVAFMIEDRPEDGSLNLLGLYSGIDNTRRGQYGYGEMPDRITLFREPLLSICSTERELRDQVHVTLVHEIGHFFGIDDAELHALGWG